MGFLSGVLEAVKDDNAVKTYDEYMPKTNKLEKVLGKLQSSIGSGRTGLAVSVAEVKGWLEGYGNTLSQKTSKVTRHLETLSSNIETNISSVFSINTLHDFDAALRLWKRSVVGQVEQTLQALEAASSELDNSLKVMLKIAFEQIKVQINGFKAGSERDLKQLKDTAYKLEGELNELYRLLYNEANTVATECINKLKAEFQSHIRIPIEHVKSGLDTVEKNLEQWSGVLQSVVNAAITQCEQIQKHVNNEEKSQERENVEKAVENLKRKAVALRTLAIAANKECKAQVRNALKAVDAMDVNLREDLFEIKGKVNEAVDNVKTEIGMLCTAIERGDSVTGAVQQESKKMENVINKTLQRVKALKIDLLGTDGTGDKSGMKKDWYWLKEYVKYYVGEIFKNDEGKIGKLQKIVDSVTKWAKDFSGKSNFEERVKNWIEEILKEDEYVKMKIRQYVEKVKSDKKYGGSYFKSDFIDSSDGIAIGKASEVAGVIKDGLGIDMDPAGAAVEKGIPSDIKEDTKTIIACVNAVAGGISDFVRKLETKLAEKKHGLKPMTTNMYTLSDDIAEKIEDKLMGNGKYRSSFQPMLQPAVQIILHRLIGKATNAAAYLKWFVGDGDKEANIGKVHEAITSIKHLGKQFHNIPGGAGIADTRTAYGSKIDQALAELQKKINEFDERLTSVASPSVKTGTAKSVDMKIQSVSDVVNGYLPFVGSDSSGSSVGTSPKKVDLSKATGFDRYKKQITQQESGVLQNAIKNIQTKVNGSDNLGKLVETPAPSTGVNNADVNGLFYDNTFTILWEQVNTSFERLCDAVNDLVEKQATASATDPQGKAVKDLLNDLQKMLDNTGVGVLPAGLPKRLNEIMVDIDTIIGTNDTANLTKIIAKAQNYYSETIGQKVTECIAGITSFLSDQVTDKIKNLKKSALTQFAKRKTAELEALQSLVSTQKSAIEHIINTDSASGLKGLLSRMRGENQYALDKIKQNSHAVTDLADVFRNYFYFLLWFIEGHVKSSPSSQLVADLQSRTYALLSHLHTNKRTFTFDAGFRTRLHDLTSALSKFDLAAFANPHHPQLLDALKAGMRGLVAEMEKAYVSRYCGKTITWSETPSAEFKPSDDATRCAKVLMSCLPMLLNDLSKVKERCGHKGEWSDKHLHIEHEVQNVRKPKNPLGTFFRDCGYKVPTSQTSKQDGELRCKYGFDGNAIYGKLVEKTLSAPDQIKHIMECESNLNERREKKKESKFDVVDLISCLHTHLYGYYTVNHYATFTATKHPSTIYDMLQWLTGLPHSPVYNALSHDGFSGLFEKDEDENKGTLIGNILLKTDDDDKLPAYPEDITANNMRGILALVCHHAEETLISLLGHGHSGGIYSCEFNTNSAKLTYPSDPSKCLDLLFEVIGRVYNQLFFLFKQCSYTTKLGGWYDCWYGQGVGGSAWNCNTLQCPGQRGEQKADQMHNQKCNQSCDQTAKCGLKSPLQSFLEDGLPGFLPHPYSKSNCKPTCSAPGHFGKVCITPMGFNDISGMASRRQQGKEIMDVLHEFCGTEHSPLSQLCSQLTCLLTRPPQTLGDMFAFYYNFLNGWNKPNHVLRAMHRENAYETAVRDANFKSDDNPLDVRSMFNNTQHGDKLSTHPKGDLCGIVSCDQPMAKDTYCGRYLQPCGQHIWTVFSKEHAGNYLSWIVYLTETFYHLLKMLYDDCNNKCGQERSKCNRTSCAVECPTKSSTESGTSSQNKYHDSKCSTIVTCKSTLPTLCRYGFVFDKPEMLHGEYGDDKKRTCKDFCNALNRVLSVVKEENDVLAKLKFETIPTFLWNIRQKFFWTTVALWSLSLFYLICVMVGRLDVLHIKSHLRIPSSHKITAQSLLAAAQVGRLAKISYLQP